jgi:hypothetical protein
MSVGGPFKPDFGLSGDINRLSNPKQPHRPRWHKPCGSEIPVRPTFGSRVGSARDFNPMLSICPRVLLREERLYQRLSKFMESAS